MAILPRSRWMVFLIPSTGTADDLAKATDIARHSDAFRHGGLTLSLVE
jgi:hypothetical protein